MTDRLYYSDAYLKKFSACVLEVKEENGEYLIRLDRSAFYPTSGGQPFDLGTLGNANILDVFVDKEGEVWHRTDAPLTQGDTVQGEIDWARRFDHMQQHAGEIGLVKILSATPSRGKLRLAFVCGMRAFLEFRNRYEVLERASNVLSTSWEGLDVSARVLSEKARNAEFLLRQEKKNAALKEADGLYEEAIQAKGRRIVRHAFSGIGMEGLREAGNAIIQKGNAIALLADAGEKGYQLFFAKSDDVDVNIGAVLSAACKKCGGKGGGKSDFAQGSAQSLSVLDEALAILTEE